MATVRELLTTWGFETDTKPLESLNKSLSDVKTTVTLIGAQAIASAGALFGLANSVATTGDEFAKTASRMGINVETLQEYSHVAQLAGSSTQEMNTSLESLTLGISEARKGGGKLIEPLIRLNQLTGKDLLTNLGSADDTMLKLADTFAQMTDDTEKAELATKIFGGTGLQMVNVLNQGSAAILKQRREARDLGIVLSQKAAKQAEQFKDSLLRTQGVITGIKNTIGVELFPIVMEFMESFRAWIDLNKVFIKSTLTKALRGMAEWLKKLIDLVQKMSKVMGAMIRTLGGFENIVRMATFALIAFTGIKFLSAIGNMTLAIRGGMAAFRALGNEALIANAKMMLMPILVGAAIAALFLIIDDIVAFFQGRDSITGKIIESLEGIDIAQILGDALDQASIVVKDFTDTVQEWISGMFDFEDPGPKIAEFVEGALTKVSEFFDGLSFDNFGQRLAEAIENVFLGESLLGKIMGFVVTVFEGIGNILIATIGGIIDTALKILGGIGGGILNFSGKDGLITKGADKASELFGDVKGFLGFGNDDSDASKNLASAGGAPNSPAPNLKLIQGGQTGSTNNVTNQNQITVPVTLPTGVTAEEGSSMVQKGIADAMNSVARETQAATATNVER